jgi:hypothetical protein
VDKPLNAKYQTLMKIILLLSLAVFSCKSNEKSAPTGLVNKAMVVSARQSLCNWVAIMKKSTFDAMVATNWH